MMVTERERQMNDQTEQLESAAPDVSSRQVEVLHLVEALRNEMRDGFQRVEQRIEEDCSVTPLSNVSDTGVTS